MIFKSMDDAKVATVLMTQEEAVMLLRAITVAKLSMGPNLSKGHPKIDVEHLRNVLGIIVKN